MKKWKCDKCGRKGDQLEEHHYVSKGTKNKKALWCYCAECFKELK